MKKLNKGFTLIELLVVIAIIGILSAVVLAALSSARSKGSDASIKSNLTGVRKQTEIEYDRGGCYGDGAGSCAAAAVTPGACPSTADTIFAEPKVSVGITGAINAGSGLAACSSSANQTAWAVVVQLKSNPLLGWCVDSGGKSKQVVISTNNQAGLTGEVTALGACLD